MIEEPLSDIAMDELRRRIVDFSRQTRDARARLTVSLAGLAHQSHRSLAELAADLGVTENDLAHLISVSNRETDDGLLVNFMALCKADLPLRKLIQNQLVNLRVVEEAYRRLSNERAVRMNREKEEREAQQAAREGEAAARRERETIARVQALAMKNMPVAPQIAIADAPGHNSKPDPLKAKTEEEFVDTMRRYRVWAHNPSLRDMAQACGWRVSHATFRNMLRAQTVPKRFDMVEAFVMALNGTEDDMRAWASAWRHFTVPAPRTVSMQDSKDASVFHLTTHRKPSAPEADHGYASVDSAVVQDAGRG